MQNSVGVVGLGVMGANLALNLERNGFAIVGYDLDASRMRRFVVEAGAGKAVTSAGSPAALAALLVRPRCVWMMVPAGAAVDETIASLAPHLEPGDILIDGGNSWFLDTERRGRALSSKGIFYLGTGVSGGEEGALRGPSLMPGGPREAYDVVAPMLRAVAARAEDGEPCVDLLGPGGAGHYVKMVHNGIEYGDMQLIAEVYDLLHRGLGLSASDLRDVFTEWNAGELKSYLMETTATVFARVDHETGRPLVDLVLDEAAQKGTGKWTSQNALDLGAAVPTIHAAVDSRILSALKDERVQASRILRGPSPRYSGSRDRVIDAARAALYAAKVTSYAQGMSLLRLATAEYAYGLKPLAIARIWRAGCIIRATLLGEIMAAYDRNPDLANLLLDPVFSDAVDRRQESWRFLVQTAVALGIPVLAMASSLAYFDAYRSERLPANLTQAQRDCFGAHTYRRTDRPGVFHSDWAGEAAGAREVV